MVYSCRVFKIVTNRNKRLALPLDIYYRKKRISSTEPVALILFESARLDSFFR